MLCKGSIYSRACSRRTPLRCSKSADQNCLKVCSVLRWCGVVQGADSPPAFALLTPFDPCSGCKLLCTAPITLPLALLCPHDEACVDIGKWENKGCAFPGLFGCPCMWTRRILNNSCPLCCHFCHPGAAVSRFMWGRLKVRLYHSACVVSGDKQAHFGSRSIFKLSLLKRNKWNPTFKWLLTPSPVTTLWQNPALPTALQDPPLSPYFIRHISVCYRSVQFHGPTEDCFVCPPCTEFRENQNAPIPWTQHLHSKFVFSLLQISQSWKCLEFGSKLWWIRGEQ